MYLFFKVLLVKIFFLAVVAQGLHNESLFSGMEPMLPDVEAQSLK